MALTLGMLVCAAPGTALADGSPAAEQLFRDGRAAMKKGDYERARTMFTESQRLDPAAGTLLNLAVAEEKLGKLASAWEHSGAALEGFAASDERIAVAKKLHEDLEGRLARLTLTTASPLPPGTKVLVDGTELSPASLGVALPQDPGPHRVVVRAPDHADREFALTLAERASRTQALELGEVIEIPATPKVPIVPAASSTPQPAPAPAPVDKEQDTSRTVGWVLTAAGGVGLVVGGITGLMTIGRKSTADSHCDAVDCDSEGYDASQQGRTLGTVSTVAFVAGAALAVGGVSILLFAPKSQTRGEMASTGPSPRSSPRSPASTLRFGVNGLGGSLSGTF